MPPLLSDLVIVLALFGISLWAFGVHWDAFAMAVILTAAYTYMMHRKDRLI
jgi:hypothetical protein